MSPRTKPKSDVFASIHSAAEDLHKAGVMDAKTMREFDESCLHKVPQYTAEDVRRIRRRANVSQKVFALYLNTSPSTVQKWEIGAKAPSGPAAKVLYMVEKLGLAALA